MAQKIVKTLATISMVIALFGSEAYANVEATYNRSCATCHDSGALGAPKRGDTATWSRLRSQKGMNTLINSTRQGMPQMPAMGLCPSCSNEDFKDLIDYMSK